jgi:aspartyl protease family protein
MAKIIYGALGFAVLVGLMSRGDDVSTEQVSPSPPQSVTASRSQGAAPQAPVGNGYAQTTLPRAPDGHFYAEMRVNGTPVKFLVDTGASMVALTREDAQRIGLQFSDGDFTGTAETASGSVGLKPVMLDRVTLGPLEANGVEAAIVQQGLRQSLLGQSWLKRIGKVTIEGDQMVLR